MLRLGLAHVNGDLRVKQYMLDASKWFKRAITNNEMNSSSPLELREAHAESLYQLFLLYDPLHSPKQSEETQKNTDTCASIIVPDETFSLQVLLEAVDMKHPGAMGKLGEVYQTASRPGFKVDLAKACSLFIEASKLGNPDAMFQLAGFYLKGADGLYFDLSNL
jgi:TPR repeat protein